MRSRAGTSPELDLGDGSEVVVGLKTPHCFRPAVVRYTVPASKSSSK